MSQGGRFPEPHSRASPFLNATAGAALVALVVLAAVILIVAGLRRKQASRIRPARDPSA